MTLQPFDRVVAEHGDVVLRVCRAVVGPHDADDAWAETFISALRAYPDLRPDSDVRAWLVTIAHRKAIDVIRRTGRAALPSGDLPDVPAPTSDVAENSDVAACGDSDALRALAELPTKQRAAVAYHHIGGLSYADVGSLIGSTEAAARRSASDGIANLRRRLTAVGPTTKGTS